MKVLPISFILTLGCIYSGELMSQELESRSYSHTTVNKVSLTDETKFINKQTGELLTADSVHRIIRANGGKISMQPRVGKYGDAEAYIVDVSRTDGRYTSEASVTFKVGEFFPPFGMTNRNGELVDSDSLRGNWIVLHFIPPFRNTQEEVDNLKRIQSYLDQNSSQTAITYIRVSRYEESIEATERVEVPEYWEFVDNAYVFSQRYGVKNFPSFYIINPEGILVRILKSGSYDYYESNLRDLQAQ